MYIVILLNLMLMKCDYDEMTWCELFFHIKVNILKSLFHFLVAKVKPAMSLQ